MVYLQMELGKVDEKKTNWRLETMGKSLIEWFPGEKKEIAELQEEIKRREDKVKRLLKKTMTTRGKAMKGILDLDKASETLENLRAQIRAVEKELSKYGFDVRRGIESYRINEIKGIMNNAKNPDDVRKLLAELIELQERLYKSLYELSGLKELSIDTDTPEGKMLTIKEWLMSGSVKNRGNAATSSKFFKAVVEVLEILEERGDVNVDEPLCRGKIVSVLNKAYKRDYDRHRVLKYLLSVCGELRALDKTQLERVDSMPVNVLVDLLLSCIKYLNRNEFKNIAISRLRK